jgi:Nuclease-related domain
VVSKDDIEQQQGLLATYRRNLAHELRRAAQYGGEQYASLGVANGIVQARAEIARIKIVLRGWGVEVDDHPDDRDQTVDMGERASTLAPSAAEPSHHGARVVLAGEYLAEQGENSSGALGIAVGVTLTVFLFSILDMVRSLLAGRSITLATIVGFVLALALGAWYILRSGLAWRRVQRSHKGEDQVVDQLRQALDHRWTIYRNLRLPDDQNGASLVLVGPGGVCAVQVEATGVPLRVQQGYWEMQRGRRWVAVQPDPARQVAGQAAVLNDFLACNGIERVVECVIALAERIPEKNVAGSPIPVWLPFNITQRAAALASKYPPSADELVRINDLLRRHADQQRAVEDAPARQRRTRSHL